MAVNSRLKLYRGISATEFELLKPVQIDVPITHVLKHFRLEFQNFAHRKKVFEIVYVVDSQMLAKNQRLWKLKTKHLA